MKEMITRFAPSPTGLLHLGHAYSALFAYSKARAVGGQFLLRIEDLDQTRCRPEFEAAILEDLHWLGLNWDGAVIRQSDRFDTYGQALTELKNRELLYPCFCSRRDIQAEIASAGNAPHGPHGPVYPGTCRSLVETERRRRIDDGEPYALRLDMEKATAQALSQASAESGVLTFFDEGLGHIDAEPCAAGDIVLARKDFPVSYHLAVTIDDAAQKITLVTRGEDLLPATHIHRLLQALLGLPVPAYHHHKLLTDETGQRFAKREKSVTLRALRDAGHTPKTVRAMAGVYFSK
ncbi:MAG: tRNA glutamyl-Q(34) synthetase GluQRS [Proteobacteria bacterium]|nr:tRNA glutamyl-Q(34) synthetase GluQRS [Pseudomonadota bacterium]